MDTQPVPSRWAVGKAKANFGLIFLVLCLIPVSSHAGGLGNAALIAIGGLGALLLTGLPNIRALPRWGWALGVFLIWIVFTALWSPYQDPQSLSNPIKVTLGAGLYLAFGRGLRAATHQNPRVIRHLIMAMAVLSAGFLILDLASGYGLTLLVDPLSVDELIEKKRSDMEMNIGHGITVLALLLIPVMTLMMRYMRYGWGLAAILAVLTFGAAHLCHLAAAQLSIFAGLVAMGLAYWMPRLMMVCVSVLGGGVILCAPFIGLVIQKLPPDMQSSLPFSWEHRAKMWGYTTDKIAQKPLQGHGFDAVRTFDDSFHIRGFDMPYISLHPHNAGLHIWVETGFIGAAILTVTLLLLGWHAAKISRGDIPYRAAIVGFGMSAIILCSVTYGVWQEWWWASLIFAAFVLDTVRAKPTGSFSP